MKLERKVIYLHEDGYLYKVPLSVHKEKQKMRNEILEKRMKRIFERANNK